jgi:hypothetical protein
MATENNGHAEMQTAHTAHTAGQMGTQLLGAAGLDTPDETKNPEDVSRNDTPQT